MSEIPENISPIVAYHSHIYFTEETRDIAVSLNEELQDLFKIWDYRWLDYANGLHPTPMFRFAILKEDFARYAEWILTRRQGLNVLVHAITGDDYVDHSYLTLWLGEKLELGLERMRKRSEELKAKGVTDHKSNVFLTGLDISQAGTIRYKAGDDSYKTRGIVPVNP
ncbi:DOPA 4,5-dioxygenase family protein [Acinetobacter chinensis]|jgi:aromatic ring-cleaving dioxygenase|uniref:DOPA 4,5-dioxygenase family protein n=1 Tax=Acinetobacter chinensis TaxID=2004650 RepID=A0ABU3WAK9_9GAMM|nr:DOPA 4,5-dioxygenase family protein [Acinetobacter chinensis]MDV2467444.1 DOPA 4,5-dioxygenase family protein [Acinetobacter chinensis]